jgi:hypothetical protein
MGPYPDAAAAMSGDRPVVSSWREADERSCRRKEEMVARSPLEQASIMIVILSWSVGPGLGVVVCIMSQSIVDVVGVKKWGNCDEVA